MRLPGHQRRRTWTNSCALSTGGSRWRRVRYSSKRIGSNLVVALIVISVSLIGGTVGYYVLEPSLPENSWIAAFGRAAMILSGMGPYDEPHTDGGRLFAGIYALYAGLLLVGTTGLILAPVFHRILHSFHVEDEEDEKRQEKRQDKRK